MTTGFVKKTQKTPKEEIQIAKDRRKDFIERVMKDDKLAHWSCLRIKRTYKDIPRFEITMNNAKTMEIFHGTSNVLENWNSCFL